MDKEKDNEDRQRKLELRKKWNEMKCKNEKKNVTAK
jgi:hypothetical protein